MKFFKLHYSNFLQAWHNLSSRRGQMKDREKIATQLFLRVTPNQVGYKQQT